jgi:hypothetical protein
MACTFKFEAGEPQEDTGRHRSADIRVRVEYLEDY